MNRQNHLLSSRPFVVDDLTLVRGNGRQIDWSRVPESYRTGAKATVTVGAAGAAQNATSVPVTVVFNTPDWVIPVGAVLDFGGGKFARVSAPYTTGANISVAALPTALVQNDVASYFEAGNAGKKYLKGGTVLSLAAAAATVVAAAIAGNTGNGTIGTVSAATTAIPGVYRIICTEPGTNSGIFAVEAPNGTTIGDAIVGTPATVGGVTFTIADGSTDFAVGDGFTVEVNVTAASKSGMAVPRALGLGTSVGILYSDAVEGDESAALNGYGVLVGGVLYENNLPDAVDGELPENYRDELRLAGTGFAYETYSDNRTSQALA